LTTVQSADAAAFQMAAARGDIERTYRAARRHSRLVRWLRVGVPLSMALVLLSVVAANYMPSIGEIRLPGDLGSLVIKGTKITMQQPKLTGYTTDSRAYEFTANAAAQDLTKPDMIELQQLHAKMEMQDHSMVEMTAPMGNYDVKSEVLTLGDDIVLVSTTGYAARLIEAVLDMKKGTVVSSKPVAVKLLNGHLNANRLDVSENGAVLRFAGGVQLTLNPDRDAAKNTAADATASVGRDPARAASQ
jgi:lipopolysaccharide export system protein LptC